jgi:hypothetical protein
LRATHQQHRRTEREPARAAIGLALIVITRTKRQAPNCFATPFVNDTHLANDPRRDPLFDAGKPRSPFQQVFSWLVPNIGAFGGRVGDCLGNGHDAVADNARTSGTARASRATARALAHASSADALALARRAQVITGR